MDSLRLARRRRQWIRGGKFCSIKASEQYDRRRTKSFPPGAPLVIAAAFSQGLRRKDRCRTFNRSGRSKVFFSKGKKCLLPKAPVKRRGLLHSRIFFQKIAMQKFSYTLLLALSTLFSSGLYSQVNDEALGAWYMYFWNTSFGEGPWGLQGDAQYRNWNIAGDLEQLLLRGGLTYQPRNAGVTFTLGYAYIATGEYGPGTNIVAENRIYQEALLPQTVGGRFFLTHRFRYEQRWVEGQDTRTRWRYNLFLNVPLNQKDLGKGAVYLALYNELFINGQRGIGNDRRVELFDRNRFYGALGYSLSDGLRIQLGLMQQTTDDWKKEQLQLSAHHRF